MRDLLAIAYRDTKPERPPSRRFRARHLAGALVLMLGLAAIPFVLEWNGKDSQKLTLQNALTLARSPGLDKPRLSSTIARLMAQCDTGFAAITKLGNRGEPYSTSVTKARARLRALIVDHKLDRRGRRTPSPESFEQAAANLQDSSINDSSRLLDSLEIVVYSLEECSLAMASRATDGEVLPEAARIFQRNLARLLER